MYYWQGEGRIIFLPAVETLLLTLSFPGFSSALFNWPEHPGTGYHSHASPCTALQTRLSVQEHCCIRYWCKQYICYRCMQNIYNQYMQYVLLVYAVHMLLVYAVYAAGVSTKVCFNKKKILKCCL